LRGVILVTWGAFMLGLTVLYCRSSFLLRERPRQPVRDWADCTTELLGSEVTFNIFRKPPIRYYKVILVTEQKGSVYSLNHGGTKDATGFVTNTHTRG
jgi:hypothetical protein